MIERIVTSNLRRAQAFDRELRSNIRLSNMALDDYESILLQPNAEKRTIVLRRVAAQLKNHVRSEVLPQAKRYGLRNARDILEKTPNAAAPGEELQRRLAETEIEKRLRTRANIVDETVEAGISRLQAKLNKFWTEPGEGGRAVRRQRMIDLHKGYERKRREYESELFQFYDGQSKTRPNAPKLDFLSELINDVRGEARTQARRIGSDSEVLLFRRNGYDQLIWITPNGHNACPDCQKRQSVVLSVGQWERYGRPGTGFTVCGDNCFCTLLPVETMQVSPSLAAKESDVGRGDGPLTTKRQAEIFNANRFRG